MRLLLVSHSSNVGGTEVCFGRALAYLSSLDDVEVVAAYPEGHFAEDWRRLAEHVPYAGSLPPWPRAKGYAGWLTRSVSGTRALKARLAEERFDAVVVFTSVATGAVSSAVAGGVPCVCYVREFVHPRSVRDRLWRFLGRRCARLIAVSSAIAEELAPFAPGRVDLVRDGVPIPEAASAWPPADEAVGCYAGYDPAKGGETFVRAAGLLAAERPELRFNYYGVAQPAQAPERDRLRRLAEELGVADRMAFHEITGFAATYADNTVVAVPSLSEGLGLVALEAMAAGVPVVASATGGLLDVVSPPAGRLVPVEDPEALAYELGVLLDDGQTLRETAALGQTRVAEEFSVDESMRGLLETVRSAIG